MLMSKEPDEPSIKPRYSISDAKRASAAIERSRRSNKTWAERRKEMRKSFSANRVWTRETHTMPREEAREFARNFLKKYPKAAYWTEIESWRVLPNDVIEFTFRRLPSSD